MALSKITYDTKVALNPQPDIANENKVTDADMNEIKTIVNNAIDQVDTNTTKIENISTYSTNEIAYGIDENGDTIYRKVLNITSGISGNFQLDISSLNIKSFISYSGQATMTIGVSSYKDRQPYWASTNDYFNVFPRDNTIQFRLGSDVSSNTSKIRLTLEYTKNN